jgi:hypothetical protein
MPAAPAEKKPDAPDQDQGALLHGDGGNKFKADKLLPRD